jgi:hypothetical protein
MADFLHPGPIVILGVGKEEDPIMSNLYSTYSVGSYTAPQYMAARKRFEHGGKFFGDYNGRDTNRGLDDLAMALQSDMAQLKSDVSQIKRSVSPATTTGSRGSRLYLNG